MAVNVIDEGADRTGVADSTAAIQAAFNSGQRIVEFEPGIYRIGSTYTGTQQFFDYCLRLTEEHNGLQVIGNGAWLVVDPDIAPQRQRLRTVLVQASSETGSVQHVRFKGLNIDCNAHQQSGNTQVSAYYLHERDGESLKQCTVSQCSLKNCQHGVFANGDGISLYKIRVTNAYDPINGIAKGFSFLATSGRTQYFRGYCLHVNGADGAAFDWTGEEAGRDGVGIFESLTARNCRQVKTQGPWTLKIKNLRISKYTSVGLKLSDARSVEIEGLVIRDGTGQAADIETALESHSISNATIEGDDTKTPLKIANANPTYLRNARVVCGEGQRGIDVPGGRVVAENVRIDGADKNYALYADGEGSEWENLEIVNSRRSPFAVRVLADNQIFDKLSIDRNINVNANGTEIVNSNLGGKKIFDTQNSGRSIVLTGSTDFELRQINSG